MVNKIIKNPKGLKATSAGVFKSETKIRILYAKTAFFKKVSPFFIKTIIKD
ncbi:unnamed protein product, partial [marine sediment metagenome]